MKQINWSALANCVKQKRRQKAFLCSAHIVLHIVPTRTSHRKKGIGEQALNEFVVGVIPGKCVVFVRSCGTDNISQIENGCALKQTRLMGRVSSVRLYLGVQMVIDDAAYVRQRSCLKRSQCGL